MKDCESFHLQTMLTIRFSFMSYVWFFSPKKLFCQVDSFIPFIKQYSHLILFTSTLTFSSFLTSHKLAQLQTSNESFEPKIMLFIFFSQIEFQFLDYGCIVGQFYTFLEFYNFSIRGYRWIFSMKSNKLIFIYIMRKHYLWVTFKTWKELCSGLSSGNFSHRILKASISNQGSFNLYFYLSFTYMIRAFFR